MLFRRTPAAAALFLICSAAMPALAGDAAPAAAAKFTSMTSAMLGKPGAAGGFFTCYLSNIGADKVTIKGEAILNGSGHPFTVGVNTCGKTLAPGKTCGFSAPLSPGFDFGGRCKALVSRRADMRGRIELRRADSVVLDAGSME